MALAPSPVVLAAAMLFAGASTGLASPSLAQAVAAQVAPDDQGRANTLINSGTSAGVALSGPVALARVGAWREAYLLFAAVAACVTLWVWLTLPTRAPSRGTGEPGVTRRVLRRPAARPLMLAALGAGASSAISWTFVGETMVEVGGLPASVTSAVWVVIGLAGFAGGAAGPLRAAVRGGRGPPRLADSARDGHPGRRLVSGSLAIACAAAALFGAAYITLAGAYLVWGVPVFSHRPAVGLGLAFLMVALGQATGALAAGAAIGTMGHPADFALFAGLALATTLVRPTKSDGPR